MSNGPEKDIYRLALDTRHENLFGWSNYHVYNKNADLDLCARRPTLYPTPFA